MKPSKPTDQDIKRIIFEITNKKVKHFSRFPTGLIHYVYDIKTEDETNLVLRLADPNLERSFEGAIYWYNLLKPKGVPLPKLIYLDLQGKHGFPVMMIERLPGKDLTFAYRELTLEQKKDLADHIIQLQLIVKTLPKGNGFGYAASYEDKFLKRTWIEVLMASVDRARKKIDERKVISSLQIEKFINVLNSHLEYFSRVEPVPYLDDITTKNVIIDNGELSGIVDVDIIAFGDGLMTPALTKAALVLQGVDTEYVDYWISQLKLSVAEEKAFDIYTGLYCIELLSEHGQLFNKSERIFLSEEKVERLRGLLEGVVG